MIETCLFSELIHECVGVVEARGDAVRAIPDIELNFVSSFQWLFSIPFLAMGNARVTEVCKFLKGKCSGHHSKGLYPVMPCRPSAKYELWTK
jgi:hypothetical protein